MSSDIYAQPDLSKKVRCSRNIREERADWEEREVGIYESADLTLDHHDDFQSQEGGQQSQKRWSLQKGAVSGATLCLGVLSITLLAAVIILSIHFTLEKNQMLSELSAKTANMSQQQEEVKKLKKEKKQLKDKIEVLQYQGKMCLEEWRKFGCSFYFKSTEKKTWFESRRDCQERGADLVIINSKEEQEFISELNMNGDSWIGLRLEYDRTQQQYYWKWVDGSPLTTTFWAAGTPTKYYYASCCNKGKWTTSSNKDFKNWICEK